MYQGWRWSFASSVGGFDFLAFHMNVLGAGKLGDFIHGLVIPSYIYATTREKADVFLTEEGDVFTTGLLQTYEELIPIIEQQPFVNSFNIYNSENIDINLIHFRHSPLLFREGWTNIYFNKFLPTYPIPYDFAWISPLDVRKSSVLINRSAKPVSAHTKQKYLELLEQYPQAQFICTEKGQYDCFVRDIKQLPLILAADAFTFYAELSVCSLFIGNQSFPLALAQSMNIPRIAELRGSIDREHYLQDVKNFSYLTVFNGD